jgi:phenylalanyl-tRNA synthetase alpha chain
MTPSTDWSAYGKQIETAKTLADLEQVELAIFGRKQGAMTLAMQQLRDVTPEEKKTLAKELNEQKRTLDESIAAKRKALQTPSASSLANDDAIDPTLELPARERGHLHLIPEFIRQVEETFGRMGFDVAYGPEVEDEEMNFDLLNFPKEHSARDAQDVFYVQKDAPKDNKWLLRAHTSPVQIRYMREHKPPFRMICPGRVYRKDADATHSPMFHQWEGLMIGKDVSLANMKAVMETAVRELIAPDASFRWRTGYFPFVEPGLEMDMRWQGEDRQTREGAWLEIVGCGMVHPNVLKNVGIDPEQWQGFAFGFGVERMLMIKHQIPSIKSFYQGDLRFLRAF